MNYQTNAHLLPAARSALDDATWAYLVGGAGSEATLRRNRYAFERLAFRPKVLRDVSAIDCTTTAFGTQHRIPVLMAPIGNLEVFHTDGSPGVGRACDRFGVMQVVAGFGPVPSDAGATGARAYQIYLAGNRRWLEDRVAAIEESGFRAIVLTVDVARRARRERQTLAGFGFTGIGDNRQWLASMTWSEVEALRGMTELPVLLKGIQTSEDAMTATEAGADGIWISNHGGRQLDHGRSTLESLVEIADVVAGRATIIVDGGVLTGSDVLKAVALGADLVGLGKLQCLALAGGGTPAVVAALEVLEDELVSQMGLLGVSRLDELQPSMVTESIPAGLPDPADPWSHLR